MFVNHSDNSGGLVAVPHQHVLNVLPLQDGLHRAKDLVPGNGHAVIHVTEHSGRNVVSLVACTPTIVCSSV